MVWPYFLSRIFSYGLSTSSIVPNREFSSSRSSLPSFAYSVVDHSHGPNTRSIVPNREFSSSRSFLPSSTHLAVDQIISDDSASEITTLSTSIEPVLDIDQVSVLMLEVASGNAAAIKRFKALVRRAKRTWKDKRTAIQETLIQRWRSRMRSSSSLALPLPLSTLSSPLEIFVDASTNGIGFVFNGCWLAWTFTPNHPSIPVSSNRQIDTCWAELVAVELGIIALVSGGHGQMPVVVMSDNKGVVNALNRRSWGGIDALEAILQRIFRVCEEAGVEVTARRVSTRKNPADKPSRGVYQERMLEWTPEVPNELAGVVNLVNARVD